MKSRLSWILTAVFAAWLLADLRPKPESGFHAREFGQLPVHLNGRVQPFDSVARNALLQFRAKQSLALSGGQRLTASEWLIELMFKPDAANDRKAFRIDHPDLLALLQLPEREKYFSLNQIKPCLAQIEKEGRRVTAIEPRQRTPFEQQTAKLFASLIIYSRLQNSVCPETSRDFQGEVAEYERILPVGLAAMKAQAEGTEHDMKVLESLHGFLERFKVVKDYARPLVVPPMHPETAPDAWANIGANLHGAVLDAGSISPAVFQYATMATAYRQNQPVEFNSALVNYRRWLQEKFAAALDQSRREFFFNDFQPFYKATVIYVIALVLALIAALTGADSVRRSTFCLVTLAWLVHTVGLIFRMWIEGRPPVTNLYSSAVFIGWGAVLLGLILERAFPIGIGLLVATIAGFVTQIIAHNLGLGGDTIEVMRAVLDTNLWLATHVIVVTLGYSATFVAGLLAAAYILLGRFTPLLASKAGRANAANALCKMVYGIICFATLFSFSGTVLGGIWADQSWGRFWGWDPKENGALILVIWNVVILHARAGGLVRERGLMNLAVFGNIVTAFSWFGVNMLGVGLHSYGFMNSAFQWLMLFNLSQALLIALGLWPLSAWKSFRLSPQNFSGRRRSITQRRETTTKEAYL